MEILVTGTTGFIGRHLIEGLKKDNFFYCLVRNKNQLKDAPHLSILEHDLTSPLHLKKMPKKLDVIIHLAQANVTFPEGAEELFRVNTGSTQELLDYGRRIGIRNFIYASSGSVYGMGKKPFRESDPPRPGDYYSITKYCSELLVREYGQFFSSIILRFFAPYGRGQVKRLIPNLISRIQGGQEVTIFNEGNPRINPIHISDVIEVMKRSLELKGTYLINVGGEVSYSIRELSDLIGALLNKKPIYRFVKDKTKSDLMGDITLMETLLGYRPRIGLKEGISSIL